jgi:hypothetical protein
MGINNEPQIKNNRTLSPSEAVCLTLNVAYKVKIKEMCLKTVLEFLKFTGSGPHILLLVNSCYFLRR